MSITATPSESTESKIRRQAEKTGRNVEEVVGKFLDDTGDEYFPDEHADNVQTHL